MSLGRQSLRSDVLAGPLNSFGSKPLQPCQALWGKINGAILSGKHQVLSWSQSDLEAVKGQDCF